MPMIPNQWKVACQEKAAATVAPEATDCLPHVKTRHMNTNGQ